MNSLNKRELRKINGGSVIGWVSLGIVVAQELYSAYKGYKDASEGEDRYD